MKVSFLIPPALDGKRAADRCYGCNYGIYFLPHLPTLYMATVLQKNGFDVEINDFAAKKLAEKDFFDFISGDDSEIYVFYTVFLSESTDILAKKNINATRKEAKFIFCGTQPTWSPDVFIDSDSSFVVRGEPEFILLDLVRRLKADRDIGDVDGVSYMEDGVIKHNKPGAPIKDLDCLPIPDRRLLDHSPYYNPKLSRTPHTAILTSRGCFGRCWFCVPNSLSFARELEYKRWHDEKPSPRLHSVERVVEEFEEIAELGFRSVSVIDDEFLWNDRRTVGICDGIKDLDLEWFCLARPDMITEKSVVALAEAGCKYIDLGVESFNQEILSSIGKGIEVEDISKAVSIIKKHGVKPKINVLLGATPLETEGTIRDTIASVERLGVEYVLYDIAAPFPGTDFYYAAKKNRWFTTEDNDYHPIDPLEESIISYPHLSKEKLEELVSYAYRRHYFNPRYLINQIGHVKSLGDFRNKTSAAIDLFNRNVLRRIGRGIYPLSGSVVSYEK
ncbi:MAG: radical SAM protein [Halobacteriota archaeon]|nr:radical SAM protein [Halobacteriota archaeon]